MTECYLFREYASAVGKEKRKGFKMSNSLEKLYQNLSIIRKNALEMHARASLYSKGVLQPSEKELKDWILKWLALWKGSSLFQ